MNSHLQFAGLSDIGTVRPNNEDVWVALPEMNFFALADGMGGHLAGEVAAKETIEFITHAISSLSSNDSILNILHFFQSTIEKTNQHIYQKSKESKHLSGMGTTLCCLYFTKHTVFYAHVGDSRIYRFRNEKLTLLTQDHSLFEKWLSLGKIAEDCHTPYPYKNVITRAIGTTKKVIPDISYSSCEENDLYLLCSDGLSDVLTLTEIENLLQTSSSLSVSTEKLIELAKIKGSTDNITVVIIQNQYEKNISR